MRIGKKARRIIARALIRERLRAGGRIPETLTKRLLGSHWRWDAMAEFPDEEPWVAVLIFVRNRMMARRKRMDQPI